MKKKLIVLTLILSLLGTSVVSCGNSTDSGQDSPKVSHNERDDDDDEDDEDDDSDDEDDDEDNEEDEDDDGDKKSKKDKNKDSGSHDIDCSIVDDEGNPIADAEVKLRNDERDYIFITDENGCISAEESAEKNIDSGEYSVSVKASGYSFYTGKETITIKAGKSIELGTIELKKKEQKFYAVELAQKSVTDIIELMGGEFETSFKNSFVTFSNQSVIPDMIFYAGRRIKYEKESLEDMLRAGEFQLIGIEVSGSALINKDLDYNADFKSLDDSEVKYVSQSTSPLYTRSGEIMGDLYNVDDTEVIVYGRTDVDAQRVFVRPFANYYEHQNLVMRDYSSYKEDTTGRVLNFDGDIKINNEYSLHISEYKDGTYYIENCNTPNGKPFYMSGEVKISNVGLVVDLGGDASFLNGTYVLQVVTQPPTDPPKSSDFFYDYSIEGRITTEKDPLNIRKAPSKDSKILGTYAKDKYVDIYGESGNWYIVWYDGNYAYISKDYVTLCGGGREKPVIYLYPEKEQDVSVKLNITDGELTCTYPDYNDGWNVTAYPDGKVINKADNEEYSYLYWESTGEMDYDFSSGFVVKREETAKFLKEKLAYMGLTPKEYNEFIVYWLPIMQKNEYNLVSFQKETYTDKAVLNISPEPDSMLRVFMAFKKADADTTVPEQKLEKFERKGFAVVEWGGTRVY